MQAKRADHFESSFDALWQVPFQISKFQMEMVVASMTVGVQFWGLWHESRGHRAIQSIDQSSFGEHRVIHCTFRK